MSSVKWGKAFLVVLMLFGLTLSAQASFIVRNTGVDNSGNALGNNVQDPHYQIIALPSGSVTPYPAYAWTSAGGFPIPPWLGDNNTSAWITPYSNISGGGDNHPVGSYIYETTFTLTATDIQYYNLAISGAWATDNQLSKIILNDQDVVTYSPPVGGFSNWYANFSITTAFQAGTNTLQFVVVNTSGSSGNPTGLRVEMAGLSTLKNPNDRPPVPEPATIGIMGLGLLGVALRRKFMS